MNAYIFAFYSINALGHVCIPKGSSIDFIYNILLKCDEPYVYVD